MKINQELLERIGYGEHDSYGDFVDQFPDGLELTLETIAIIDDWLDMNWILSHFLPGDMVAEYDLARSDLGYASRRQKDVVLEKLAQTEAHQQCMVAIDQANADYERARHALILRMIKGFECQRDDAKPVNELTIEEALVELRAYKGNYVLPPRIAEILEKVSDCVRQGWDGE